MRSDEELIQEFVETGSEAAVAALVRKYKDRLVNYVARMVRDHQWAEDIIQDTFVKAYYNAHSYRGYGRFSSWLYRIALNTCRSAIRGSSRRRALETLDSTGFSTSCYSGRDSASPLVEEQERIKAVKQAVSQLPVAEREAIILREYQGLSYREIAEMTEESLASVKSRIYRARRRIGDILRLKDGDSS